jgi:hypothetical protein
MTIGGLIGDGEYSLLNLVRPVVPLVMRNSSPQLQAIIKHDPTGNGYVKEPFFFVHPHVEQEYGCTDKAPDRLKPSCTKGSSTGTPSSWRPLLVS